MTSLYLDLDKSFLEKNRSKMEEEAEKSDGEKSHLVLELSDNQADVFTSKIEEIDDESNTITLVADGDFGSVWLTAELSIDQLIQLLEVATKKLNKVKTVLEAVK
jgi:hypothetical protein